MKFLNFAINTAKKAGALILEKSKKNIIVAEKAKNDLITNIDKASENLIIQEIQKNFPDHAIFAEESVNSKKSFNNAEYVWFIDPLDGTTNFVHGLPIYAVSIGLLKKNSIKGEILAGVVFAPVFNELFYAEKGKGAYLNGKKIKVSSVKKLADSMVVTGFPPTQKEINLPYLEIMIKKAQAVRRLGSAALDLCYTACGRFDGFWEFGLKPWDIAAGSLIVKEAGGKITDTNGNIINLFGADILASNKKIHKEMVRNFKKL